MTTATQPITIELSAIWSEKVTPKFRAIIIELGVTLPVLPDRTQPGVIIDANGRDLATADSNGNRPDDEALALAGVLAFALNSMAGFAGDTVDIEAGVFVARNIDELPASKVEGGLADLLSQASKRLAAMTPDERVAHDQAQCESFIRGMTTPCEHGALDFEQCPQCRGEQS